MAEENIYRGGDIDRTTFEQILEMDEDPTEREFSRSIVFDFFQQADETFEKMDKFLDEKDFDQLSALGHFLKGSSATLGLTRVKDSCEKIQHFGARKDETGTHDVSDDKLSLTRIRQALREVKVEYRAAETKLRDFYGEE